MRHIGVLSGCSGAGECLGESALQGGVQLPSGSWMARTASPLRNTACERPPAGLHAAATLRGPGVLALLNQTSANCASQQEVPT